MIFGGLFIGSKGFDNELKIMDFNGEGLKQNLTISLGEKGDMFTSTPIFQKDNMILLGKKHMYILNQATNSVTCLLNQGEINAEDIARKLYYEKEES
jgi:hypothetical protein